MREPSTVLALLATIAPTLYSVAASADSPDPPVQGENQPTPPKEYDRYNWNLGLGEDFRTTMSMHALYDLRSKQRAGTSLSYLAPVNDGSYSQKGDYNVFVGRRLAKWLDVEFMAHLDTDLQIFSVTPVVDPAFSGTTQESFEDHHTEFGESAYSVTFLPQWDLRRWLGVYGRIGVGYAESEVSSNLRSYGRILIDRRCRTDQYGRRVMDSFPFSASVSIYSKRCVWNTHSGPMSRLPARPRTYAHGCYRFSSSTADGRIYERTSDHVVL
jgi:opacity protein-like surface antigen